MSTSTLPRPLRSPLLDYWERSLGRTIEPVSICPPAQTPMRRLTQVEFATLSINVAATADLAPPFSILCESAVRLGIWEERGLLQYFSGEFVARCLQDVFWPHSRNARRPWRGYELLRFLDANADRCGVEVWISGAPIDDAPDRFRRMRLTARLEELEGVGIVNTERTLSPNSKA